jgi:2,3-bisphosphoglycerate-independent phosphoglycerate mutase
LASTKQKAVLAVTDGLGFNRARARRVVETAWERLDAADRKQLVEAAERAGRDSAWATNILYPVHVESLEADKPTDQALSWIGDLDSARESLGHLLRDSIDAMVELVADEHRYVPWASEARDLWALRNENLSIPTSASGVWTGFEDLEPAVQGNSETGHQQIGNTRLAPQLPLEITRAIDSGEFFDNPALNGVISRAHEKNKTINFCYLLSGVGGGEGRVHSAWNHLEAFLELVFVRHGFEPGKVQMQAILDGRDSAVDSSIRAQDASNGGNSGSGDFLGRLQQLLAKYDATGSLAWVVGRATAMDRDYREAAAKSDFDHLTGAIGLPVPGFDEVRASISRAHSEVDGNTDQDVPPISVLRPDGSMPAISAGDAFVDLNFRSDRQRSKIGSLAGARAFIASEGASRGRAWDGAWIDHNLGLDICGIAEYHPVFEAEFGVSVAFPTEPHADNFLAQWPELAGSDEYTLVAESVKASHMGYFFRGRREGPVPGANEVRVVTPSHGEEDGVKTDSDFYLHPGMRAKEVTAAVNAAIAAGTSRLICCNIAAPDMVGHLLPARYEEAKAAYMAAAEALVAIAESARMHGRSMVITSDHGNIEDDTSAHSVNDVLTTIILPYTRTGTGSTSTKATVGIPVFQARLFDIAPTLLRLLGLQPSGPETAEKAVATTGSTPAAHTFATTNSQEIPDYFAGKPLVVTG